jgi:hypothetical protein
MGLSDSMNFTKTLKELTKHRSALRQVELGAIRSALTELSEAFPGFAFTVKSREEHKDAQEKPARSEKAPMKKKRKRQKSSTPLTPEIKLAFRQMFHSGTAREAIISKLGISNSSAYNIQKELGLSFRQREKIAEGLATQTA